MATLLFCVACSSASGTVLRRNPADAEPPQGAGDAAVDGAVAGDGSVPGDGATGDGAVEGDASSPPPGTEGVCRLTLGDGFVDQFDGDALSKDHWLVAHGNVAVAGERSAGGFVRDNIAVRGGKLILSVRGDAYTGSIRGIAQDGKMRANGVRTGAAIATHDLFMSATYQWEGRLSAPAGIKLVLAMMRDDPEDGMIAITAPGLTSAGEPSYAFASAYVQSPLAAAVSQQIALPSSLDDGESHSLRFDWHAGPGPTSPPAADFWQGPDNLQTLTGDAPARAGRAWLLAFVPDGAVADFETAEIEISTAFITPFGETRDRCTDGELASPVLETPR